jgi:ribose/xylose/arabinose/galactoside ABC-type transport system permease subunit
MNYQKKYVFRCLLAIAALLSAASFQPALAQTAPALGASSSFAVLGSTAVTCTNSVITGDVGISPGGAAAITQTGCTIVGDGSCERSGCC